MIEGGIERLGEDGIFLGWLRDTDDSAPAVLDVRTGGRSVAQAAARAFRADLLAGGHGHGHYGFAARLTAALPPGTTEFELFLPRRDQAIRLRLPVPPQADHSQTRVENLFEPETSWTAADLARSPACLDLAAQRAAMGTARFVDVTFRFALRRWPNKHEAGVFRRALNADELSPTGLLLELLGGRERADLGQTLASPWDPEFPYIERPPAASRRAAARPRRGGAA